MEFWQVIPYKIDQNLRCIAIVLLLFCVACNMQKIKIAGNGVGEFVQEDEVKLAGPIVRIDSMFFKKQARVLADFRMEGASILYKFDDQEYSLYSEPIVSNRSGKITFRTEKETYNASDEFVMPFVKMNDHLKESNIQLIPAPDLAYSGDGSDSLSDQLKGDYNYREGNKWCGWQDSLVQIRIELASPMNLEKIWISTLTDIPSSIFNPKQISIFSENSLVAVGEWNMENDLNCKEYNIIPLSFTSIQISSVVIEIINEIEVPQWHPNSGNRPWVFIDEIILE